MRRSERRWRCSQTCCQAASQRLMHVDGSGISAQLTASDGRCWTKCPLLRIRCSPTGSVRDIRGGMMNGPASAGAPPTGLRRHAGQPAAWPGPVDGPGAAAGDRHLPDRRMVCRRRARAGRPDAGGSRNRPRWRAERPDRGMRAAAARDLRHARRCHRRRARAHLRRGRRRPHRAHRHDSPSRCRAAGAEARAKPRG